MSTCDRCAEDYPAEDLTWNEEAQENDCPSCTTELLASQREETGEIETLDIRYVVNGRAEFATVELDYEGNFTLDGMAFHRAQLQEVEAFGGGTLLVLSEYDYTHVGGACDVRGCCNN